MQDTQRDLKMNNKPIRVLQIIGIICGGGVEAVIMNYYRHIDRSKVQFDFVVDGFERTQLDDEIEAMGGQVYHVTPYRKNVFSYMKEIATIIRENHYEIVHSNMNTLACFSLFAAWCADANVRILHNHSMAVSQEGLRSVLKYILRPFSKMFANHYFACSILSGEWMYGSQKMKTGEVKILNNAIDVDKFLYNEKVRQELRKELGIAEDDFVVGHIGRFMFQKNHAFLLDIFAAVHKVNKKAKLVLVGDGELRPEMEEKAKTLGIDDSVMFLGLRKDTARLYNIMDVFVLPSWYEGLPVVSVEAQANGLTCLLSDRIAKESKLVDNVEFLKLEIGAKGWADRILAESIQRENGVKEKLEARGFSVKKETHALEEFYSTAVYSSWL